jgi:hypothetical protein
MRIDSTDVGETGQGGPEDVDRFDMIGDECDYNKNIFAHNQFLEAMSVQADTTPELDSRSSNPDTVEGV